MRLVFAFDKKNIALDKDDIVITRDYSLYDYYKSKGVNVKLVNIVNLYYSEKTKELQSIKNQVLSNFLLDDKLKPLLNYSYFRFQLPLALLFNFVDEVIMQHHVDELVLVGGNKTQFFASVGGEGEGKLFLFKYSWFYNYFIFLNYRDRLKITWLKRESKAKINFVFWYRELIVEIKECLSSIKKSFLKRNQKTNEILGVENVYYAPLEIQKNHLIKVKNVIRHDANSCFLVESVINGEVCSEISQLSFFDVIKVFLTSHTRKKIFKSGKVWFNERITLSKSKVNRIYKNYLLEYLLNEQRVVNNLLKFKNVKNIITDMTYGLDIFAVNSASHKVCAKHINYQYVTMPPIPLLSYEMSDIYYVYSLKCLDVYSKESPIFKKYFLVDKPPVIRTKSKSLKVCIFLQPDDFSEAYLKMVKKLCNMLSTSKLDLELLIKPHPRQKDVEKYKKEIEQYDFTSIQMCDSKKLLDYIDLTITITSSIVFESLSAGVMSIIYNPDGVYTDLIANMDELFAEVNYVVRDEKEIMEIIQNFDHYQHMFVDRYKSVFNKDD